MALLRVPVVLEGGCLLCVHREVVAAERSVKTLFPLGAAPDVRAGLRLGLLDRSAADAIRKANEKIGTFVTSRRVIAGSDPFGPCLVNLTFSNGKESFRFLANFFDGKCTEIDPVPARGRESA